MLTSVHDSIMSMVERTVLCRTCCWHSNHDCFSCSRCFSNLLTTFIYIALSLYQHHRHNGDIVESKDCQWLNCFGSVLADNQEVYWPTSLKACYHHSAAVAILPLPLCRCSVLFQQTNGNGKFFDVPAWTEFSLFFVPMEFQNGRTATEWWKQAVYFHNPQVVILYTELYSNKITN